MSHMEFLPLSKMFCCNTIQKQIFVGMEKMILTRVNTDYTDLCIFRKHEYRITKDLLSKSCSFSHAVKAACSVV